MNIEAFLTEIFAAGQCISLEGDKLRVTGNPNPATLDLIRQHKPKIVHALKHPQHGACVHCGTDTKAMLTVPNEPRCWCCAPCFKKRKTHP